MSNIWAIVSLLALFVVVYIANKKKMNVGLLGIAMAMLLGTLAGIRYKDIIAGFNTSLFLRAIAMQSLIVIAKMNGTLESISKRIIKVGCGKAIRVLPIILYISLMICEFLGTGIYTMAVPILCAIAYEMGMPVLKILSIGLICTTGGGCSPYAYPGIILRNLAEAAGLSINLWNTAVSGTIVSTILFIGLYFFFGWHKETPRSIAANQEALEPISWKQWATIVGYLTFVFCNLVLGLDTGITPIIVSVLLCLIGAADGTQIMKRLPFNSLIMVGGMTVLIGVVAKLGGIDLITSGLVLIANKTLAPAIMSLVASCLSVISSAQSVVMPTLVPTIPGLVEAIPGVSAQSLVSDIGLGAYATGASPLSTTGANVMANFGTVYSPTPDEEKKLFNQLLVFAIISLVTYTVAGVIGIYAVALFH